MAGKTVLVVDDNPTNLKLAKVTLEIAGFDVHTAVDADGTFSFLASHETNIILMDLQLPGIDGLELTRQLKANPKYKHIPIVAVTSYAMKGDEEKALEAGFDGYISKPIDTEKLADFVNAHLSRLK